MCYACCHGDGSGVSHVHIEYTLSDYCVPVAMATIVMGDTCVQSIMEATMLVIA